MKQILLILCSLLLSFGMCHAQDSKKVEVKPNALSKPVPPANSFWRNVYYDADWKTLPNKTNAVYYREPVIKNGDRYEVGFFRADGTRVKTCSYLPVTVNYQLSIDEGVGIKDGPFTFYDAKGEKDNEGNYVQNKMEGPWKYYKNGRLYLTSVYKDGFIVSETLEK